MQTGYWHLETLWFVLIAVLWIGYFVLEGFDFGVGMLLPSSAADEADRRVDDQHDRPGLGRQRGVAARPRAARRSPPSPSGTRPSSRASTSPLFLILVALIVRGVAFEYRGKHDSGRWRARWDAAIVVGERAARAALGRRVRQYRPRGAARRRRRVHGHAADLLNPYALLGGARDARALHAPRRGVPDAEDEGRAAPPQPGRGAVAVGGLRSARVRLPALDLPQRRLGGREGHRPGRDPDRRTRSLAGRPVPRARIQGRNRLHRDGALDRADHGDDLPQPLPARARLLRRARITASRSGRRARRTTRSS